MKKPKSAWNRFVLWAGVAGLLLAGCAKPVETALPAMQLDLAQMLEKASAGTEDGAWPLAQRYGVPPHVLEDISAVDGRLQIRLNADTVVPQAAQVPILRVKRAVHNPDAVNALVSGMKGQLTFDENNPASFLFVARGPYYGIDCHQRTVTGPESFTDGEWALLTISPAEARAAAEQFIAAHNLPMAFSISAFWTRCTKATAQTRTSRCCRRPTIPWNAHGSFRASAAPHRCWAAQVITS